MLPRPSRLKSLASELSPVLTTPPPVEPKTVFVLMSVPEMMLSSNFVPLRRRAAIMAAMPPRITSAPAPMAQFGTDENRSVKNPGGSAFGAAALATGALAGAGDGAGPGVAAAALVSVAAGAGVAGAVVAGAGVPGAGVGGGTAGAVAEGAGAVGLDADESVGAGAALPR